MNEALRLIEIYAQESLEMQYWAELADEANRRGEIYMRDEFAERSLARGVRGMDLLDELTEYIPRDQAISALEDIDLKMHDIAKDQAESYIERAGDRIGLDGARGGLDRSAATRGRNNPVRELQDRVEREYNRRPMGSAANDNDGPNRGGSGGGKQRGSIDIDTLKRIGIGSIIITAGGTIMGNEAARDRIRDNVDTLLNNAAIFRADPSRGDGKRENGSIALTSDGEWDMLQEEAEELREMIDDFNALEGNQEAWQQMSDAYDAFRQLTIRASMDTRDISLDSADASLPESAPSSPVQVAQRDDLSRFS